MISVRSGILFLACWMNGAVLAQAEEQRSVAAAAGFACSSGSVTSPYLCGSSSNTNALPFPVSFPVSGPSSEGNKNAPTVCGGACLSVTFKGETEQQAVNNYEQANNCVFPGPISKCVAKDKINYHYLYMNENDSVPPRLTVYVPNNNGVVIDQSGVTIGVGVDLGHWSLGQISKWNIGHSLINKIRPYLSPLRGQKALSYVATHPLALTAQEVAELDSGAMKFNVGHLISDFNSQNKLGINFYNLPAGTQTALADFFYQHGAYSNRGYPTLWKAIINGEWADAAKLLSLEPGRPHSRLIHDGRLVMNDVTNDDYLINGEPACSN